MSTTVETDEELAAAVRYTSKLRTGFYLVVLLVALAGQVSGAVERLHLPWYLAAPAVGALELGGMVVLSNADVRRRLGERAVGSRILSAGIAGFAVAFNWLCHADHLLGAFFAGMSALGYLVWLMSTGNARRDRLRAKGHLPPVPPMYGLWRWLRHPARTARARALALAEGLDLYGSLAAVRDAEQAEQERARQQRRQAAISDVLRRKIAASADKTTAEIAVTVFDLDEIAARLAAGADYDGLTALIGADLMPARLLAPTDSTAAPEGPAAVPLSAHLPAVVLAEVRRDVAAVTAEPSAPVAATPKATPSGRRKPASGRGRKPAPSVRRSTEETRQLAAQLRAERPDITRTDLARLLGISPTRLRQVEHDGSSATPHNGVDLLGQPEVSPAP